MYHEFAILFLIKRKCLSNIITLVGLHIEQKQCKNLNFSSPRTVRKKSWRFSFLFLKITTANIYQTTNAVEKYFFLFSKILFCPKQDKWTFRRDNKEEICLFRHTEWMRTDVFRTCRNYIIFWFFLSLSPFFFENLREQKWHVVLLLLCDFRIVTVPKYLWQISFSLVMKHGPVYLIEHFFVIQVFLVFVVQHHFSWDFYEMIARQLIILNRSLWNGVRHRSSYTKIRDINKHNVDDEIQIKVKCFR